MDRSVFAALTRAYDELEQRWLAAHEQGDWRVESNLTRDLGALERVAELVLTRGEWLRWCVGADDVEEEPE